MKRLQTWFRKCNHAPTPNSAVMWKGEYLSNGMLCRMNLFQIDTGFARHRFELLDTWKRFSLFLQGERRLRGSGFFPMASLLNHDCLPNTARFDDFDKETSQGQPGETIISVRALHDIPAGEEITASYFPLTLGYDERQKRCQEQYGFQCSCLRCQVIIRAWMPQSFCIALIFSVIWCM